MNWYLFLCLIVAWIIVYLSLFKGVKSSGKVSIMVSNIDSTLTLFATVTDKFLNVVYVMKHRGILLVTPADQ